MSIFVKNVTWSQTESNITVIVPICGRKSIDDVVIGEGFLKVNVRPYFYEVFFDHPICIEQSSCKLFESSFKFNLKKVSNERWHNLGKLCKSAADSNEGSISFEAKKEIYSKYEDCVAQEIANRKKENANSKRTEMDKEMQRQSQIRQKISDTETALKNQQISEVFNHMTQLVSINRYLIRFKLICFRFFLYWICRPSNRTQLLPPKPTVQCRKNANMKVKQICHRFVHLHVFLWILAHGNL